MKFNLNKKPEFAILTLEEENLIGDVSNELKSEFVFIINEGVRNLIFDIANVKTLDSSGLSAVLTGNRLYKGFGKFILSGAVNPTIKKLVELSRLRNILNIYDTIIDAILAEFDSEFEKERII